MKKVCACENAALIGHLRDVLAERGIVCVVRNFVCCWRCERERDRAGS